MSTMRCAKRIVDEHIGKFGEPIGDHGIVRRLAWLETGVLENHNRPGRSKFDDVLDTRTDHPRGEHRLEPPEL